MEAGFVYRASGCWSEEANKKADPQGSAFVLSFVIPTISPG